MEKFAVEQAAGGILNEQMVDGVIGVLIGDGLAAHDASADGVDTPRLDVLDGGEMDAVFVTEGQVSEQVLEGVNAALGEEFGALRADALDQADFGGKSQSHGHFFISLSAETV